VWTALLQKPTRAYCPGLFHEGVSELRCAAAGELVSVAGTALFVAGVGAMGQQDAARRAVLLQSTVPALMAEVVAVDTRVAFQGG